MKKPTEAIEWLKEYGLVDTFAHEGYVQEILAYIDSIPEWPAYLTRERLEELASEACSSWYDRSDALRRLAAIAPKRGKRKVALWQKITEDCYIPKPLDWVPDKPTGWRKVGEVELDA